MNLPVGKLLRALAALAAAGAIAVLSTGCGSTSATLDPVAQAAEVTSASGGVHMRMSMHLMIPGLTSPVSATGQGFFNYKTHEGKLALEMTGLPSSATSVLGSGALQVEELIKSTSIYVGSPVFASHLPGGARWMKVDLSKIGGIDIQSLTSGESNPAQFLEYLRAHGGSVTQVGSESLGGVHTTRYHGTIDLNKVAENLPESERAAAKASIQQLTAETGLSSIPFDVWVDDQHRVRRIEMNISVNVAGQNAGMVLKIDLSKYGPTPAVTAPADSEVFSAPASISGIG